MIRKPIQGEYYIYEANSGMRNQAKGIGMFVEYSDEDEEFCKLIDRDTKKLVVSALSDMWKKK